MVISVSKLNNKGFTLVELLISISIFVFMTILVVVKYGTFNQSVLLTDLAYDVGLTIRTAQTYGLSVQGNTQGETLNFNYAYGVHFDAASSGSVNNSVILFADRSSSLTAKNYTQGLTPIATAGVYDFPGDDPVISTYIMKRGAIISGVCANASPCTSGSMGPNKLDITFKRPDPSAYICLTVAGQGTNCGWPYAGILIKGTDGSTRMITIQKDGQVTIGQ